jgi:hypothetical protein
MSETPPEEVRELKDIIMRLIDKAKTETGRVQLQRMSEEVEKAYRHAKWCEIDSIFELVDSLSWWRTRWLEYEKPSAEDDIELNVAMRRFHHLLTKTLKKECKCSPPKWIIAE